MKSAPGILSLGALALGLALSVVTAPAQTVVNAAAGKSVTGAYYDSGSEVFPSNRITDGRTGDTGSPYDWSFWLSPQGTVNVPLTIDLLEVFSLNSFVLQNSHNRGYFDRGTQDFALRVSLDGIAYTTVFTGTFTAAEWRDLSLVTVSLATPAVGRYLQFEPLSLYGGQSAGLNELQAFGVPVPEPGAGLLLGVGLSAFAVSARGRFWRDRRRGNR